MSDAADEAGNDEYRALVLRELRARETKLAAVERELADLEFRLRRCASGHLVRDGYAQRAISAEAFRRKLLAERNRVQRERGAALDDVGRARERLEMLEQEEAGGAPDIGEEG